MAPKTCDGKGLLIACRSVVANLQLHVDERSTPSTSSRSPTARIVAKPGRGALMEAEKVGEGATVERVAQAVSFGVLMGARSAS